MAKNKNVDYKLPNDGGLFTKDEFAKLGGTAQGSVVRKRINDVYKEITEIEL